MKTFEHRGHRCISINGKDYYLVRGYSRSGGDNFLFVQVTGSTPLRKEDMPNKDWTVMSSRIGEGRVWTAYRRPWFQYQMERESPNLAFVGASDLGSYYLALRFLERRYKIGVNDKDLVAVARRVYGDKDNRLIELSDEGNIGTCAVTVELGDWHWGYNEERREEEARLLFERS
jgi:hypothetical protein